MQILVSIRASTVDCELLMQKVNRDDSVEGYDGCAVEVHDRQGDGVGRASAQG
jgi:hypothetical protein